VLWSILVGVALVSAAISVNGCGGSSGEATHAPSGRDAPASSLYVSLLGEFRDAAKANATYDAYGFAIDLRGAQKAVIDGFCVVVTEVGTGPESRKLADPAYFSDRIRSAARSEAEAENASPASIRRAVDQLKAIVEPESFSPALVKSYAKACY
jgi:hypothetical protein